MNQSSEKQVVMLPSDFERQQIFYWLKRVSSVNAWRRPQFCETLIATASAWGECGPYILGPRYLDVPAQSIYGVWMKNAFKSIPFPNNLHTVPDPLEKKSLYAPIYQFRFRESGNLSLMQALPNLRYLACFLVCPSSTIHSKSRVR